MICWRAGGLVGEVREYRLGPVSLCVVSRADSWSLSHLRTCARIPAVFASTTPPPLLSCFGVGSVGPDCLLLDSAGMRRTKEGPPGRGLPAVIDHKSRT